MGLKILYGFYIMFFLKTVISSIKKSNNQFINAYSFFSLEISFKIILSSLIIFVIKGDTYDYNNSFKVLAISTVFIFSIWLGYINKSIPNFFLKNSKIFFRQTERIKRFKGDLGFYAFVFLGLGLICFLMLMIKGGGGSLWLTDSRTAYQFFRKGAGGYYVFSQIFMYLSFVSFLFKLKKLKLKNIISLLTFFVFIFLFYGSKRSLVTLILMVIVFYSYYVNNIKKSYLFFFFFFIAAFFLITQFLFSNLSVIDSINYFTYFDNMVLFLQKNPDFTFMNGKSTFSNSWSLVPRSIYPDKPFVYGSAYISELVYPGSAASTHTIGVLPWAMYYLDFGYIGVFFGGLITGISLKYIQLLFMVKKDFFIFLLFINYGISNILKHVPVFVFILLIVLSINYLRIKIIYKE